MNTKTPTHQQLSATTRPGRDGAGVNRALRRAWREALVPIGAHDVAAIAALRAITRVVLSGWGMAESTVADVELVVSELATNAVVHTSGPVRVRLARSGGVVRIDVADTDVQPAPCDRAESEAEGGRGVGVACALSDRLSVKRLRQGKIVTAEVTARGADSHGPTAS